MEEAKEAKVWPEGKEKSPGGGIRSVTAVLTVKGRILEINGFRIMFPLMSMRIKENAEATPARLVRGKRSRRMDRTIHMIPASPREERGGMRVSIHSQ